MWIFLIEARIFNTCEPVDLVSCYTLYFKNVLLSHIMFSNTFGFLFYTIKNTRISSMLLADPPKNFSDYDIMMHEMGGEES